MWAFYAVAGMHHPFRRLEDVLKRLSEFISRVSYLQLVPRLRMDGDIPPLLCVFIVCTRTVLYCTFSMFSQFSFALEGRVTLYWCRVS